MKSLLDQAKDVKGRERKRRVMPVTREHLELALGLVGGEITIAQFAAVMDEPDVSRAYVVAARLLFRGIRDGILAVRFVREKE